MPTPDEKAKQARKRLTDYVQAGVQLEGDRINLEDILGEDIELTDFVFLPGVKFEGEFAVIQFRRHDSTQVFTTSTGGKVVMEALKQMPKNYLPVDIKIIRTKGKSGTKYLTIE